MYLAKSTYKFFFTLLCIFAVHSSCLAQEINFGQYAQQNIEVTLLNPGTAMDFGQVLAGEGLVSIALSDPNVAVFSIEAEFDKDLFVTISAPPTLDLDMSNSIPFTMKAAFANNGNDNIAEATLISGNAARFPVLRRQTRPPGTPPTPQHKGYATPTATAYLYIYGDISVGSVPAGIYSGTINITISYEDN